MLNPISNKICQTEVIVLSRTTEIIRCAFHAAKTVRREAENLIWKALVCAVVPSSSFKLLLPSPIFVVHAFPLSNILLHRCSLL
jgi:hypothetical protein